MDAKARTDDGLTKGLGLFSLGLGLAQVAMPARVNRLIGIEDTDKNRNVMLGVGIRELIAAGGILTNRRPVGWVGSRVAGDAMDFALLGAAMGDDRNDQRRLRMATVAVSSVTLLDLMNSGQLAKSAGGQQRDGHRPAAKEAPAKNASRAKNTITVNVPASEAYALWHDFERLPSFMHHLKSVTNTGVRTSHWVTSAPLGKQLEWDAEVVEDVTDEYIAWRSVAGADVRNSGSVRFRPAPGDRGTEVIVEMDYTVPGGAAGAAFAKLLGESPQQQIQDDLRRFKQVLETGEVLRSEGAPEGTSAKRQLKPRPAQPVKAHESQRDATFASVGGGSR